jgi:hypothetical protein
MNARAPLRILSDDCWENVHPDILHLPQGFVGYPYWMAFTPYPGGNDRLENPTLRASHDGLSWVRIPGLSDPVIPPPEDPEAHNADPDLAFHGGRLHMVYVTSHEMVRESTFTVVSSADIVHWSPPCVIQNNTGGFSPTCVVDWNLWRLWFVRPDVQRGFSSSQLLYRQGPDFTHLGDEHLCQLDIPGHILWHIDVQRVAHGYEALAAAFPEGMDGSRTRLFHTVSADGLSFVLSRREAILKPSFFGWDNRMIYRSSFLKEPDGTYRIWYSAGSWGRHFGIGYVQGPLDNLKESDLALLVPVQSPSAKLFEDLTGFLSHSPIRDLQVSLAALFPGVRKHQEDSHKDF